MNEMVKRVTKRIFDKCSNIKNFVMLEGLIKRFLQLNPDADPEAIDWAGVWDDTLTYDELIQTFKTQYPMYRWDRGDSGDSEEKYDMDRVRGIVEDISTKIDVEEFDRLIKELQKLRDEILEDVRRLTETAPPKPEPVEAAPKPETPPPAEVKPSLTLFAKFPFLSAAHPLLRAYNLQTVPEEVKVRAVERIMEALERGERGVIPRLEKPWVELLSFPYARALVNFINDDWLRRRWALAEAARVERLLHAENDETLQMIISELNVTVTKNADGWTMHFTQFLHLTRRLGTEPRFKLVNRLLDKGMVSLTRPELIRLVRERLYEDFSEEKMTPSNWSPEEAGVIREALNRRASKIIAPAPSGDWAPCMVALRNRVADAGHFELFALAAYMAQRGYKTDEIVEVFKVRTDFDQRVALYQVEHIAGLRGSRVKYKPPSCQSMKTHGLCIDNGRYCPHGIKNPLQYRPTGSAGPRQGSG